MPDTEFPPPTRHCPACGRGHYAAVAFCPFCGAAQAAPETRAEPAVPAHPGPLTFRLEADGPLRPRPPPQPRPPEPAPSPIPSIAASTPPTKPPSAERESPRRRFRIGRAVLAVLAIGALAAGVLAGRGRLPAPAGVSVGPAWTGIAVEGFKAAPVLRLSADAPFSVRLDGERVQRVAPGSVALVRLRALRGLELRSARGRVTVLLTPQAE